MRSSAIPGGAVYEDQFSERHDFPAVEGPTAYYVIASTPRCGSHLLGHSLFQEGVFGFPLEYFNPVNFPRWRERFGTEGFHETYAAIRSHRTSPNGCFGVKLHFSHFKQLVAGQRFEDLFPGARVIHLEREDLLAQAVSLARARQTRSWIAAQPVQAEPEYDSAAIDRAMRDIVCDTASWRLALGQHGWPVMRIAYEDFLRAPDQVILQIARYLEVDLGSQRVPTLRLPERQGDQINREWKTRYLSEPRGGVDGVMIRPAEERIQAEEAGLLWQTLRALRHAISALRRHLGLPRGGAGR